MFLKKVGSFALISGTLSSFACQSVSGVQGDLQKKASVVNAGKQNLVSKQNESKSVDKNVVEKSILQKGSAVSEQNKKQVKTILFGEYSDLLLNYLSKAFGVHEHWKSLFETYEGDPYKAAKYALAALLLVVRGWYVLEAITGVICAFYEYFALCHTPDDSFVELFSSWRNLGRERTLFNLYAYNCSLPACILRALCPAVSAPALVLRVKSILFSEEEIVSLKLELLRLTVSLELGKNEEFSLEENKNMKDRYTEVVNLLHSKVDNADILIDEIKKEALKRLYSYYEKYLKKPINERCKHFEDMDEDEKKEANAEYDQENEYLKKRMDMLLEEMNAQ